MNSGATAADILTPELAAIREMRRNLQDSVKIAYFRLEEDINRAKNLLECVSQSVADVIDTDLIFPSAVSLATKLQTAHRLLFTVDLLCDGGSTLARLQSLLQTQSLDKALALAANSIMVRGASETGNDKILDVLSQWEATQQPGPIVPLTLSLNDWRDRLFPPISPIIPALLPEDTTKLFSLHVQLLAQQIDRAFTSIQVAHRSLGHLATIRNFNQDELLFDLYRNSVEHVLMSAAAVLRASLDNIFDSSTDSSTDRSADSSADHLQLLANLTARLLSIIETRIVDAESLINCSITPLLKSFEETHTRLLHAYRDVEIKFSPEELSEILHSDQPNQFDGTVERIFRRIQGLERADSKLLTQLEQTIVHQTISCARSQQISSLFAEYKLLHFACAYASDESIKEQLSKKFHASLEGRAVSFVTEAQPAVRILAQAQDPVLFLEQLSELINTEDDPDGNYITDLSAVIISYTSLALANILIRSPIPISQVTRLRLAFKEVVDTLRIALQKPVTSICAPLLALHGIMTSSSPEEAASYAKGTCLEGVYLSLAQSYGLTALNKQSTGI